VTRGMGTLGLKPEELQTSIGHHHRGQNPALSARRFTSAVWTSITVPTTRNLHSALNPAIKSLNYLNNILAKIEANNGGCEEAVMLNAEGFVPNARATICSL